MKRTLVFVIALIASLTAADAASAVLAGKNGRIVFTSGREGANDNQAQLYIRTMLGSSGGGVVDDHPVGIPGVQNRHASWSPDRTRIVFAAGTPGSPTTEEYDLYIRDLVENTVAPLDTTQLGDGLSSDHPAWSPDGTRIAYEQQTADNSAQRDIKVKTVGTAAPAVSLTSGGPVEFKPAWSSDSTTVYYAAQMGAAPASDLDIYQRPVDGGPATPVVHASGVDEYQPSISPDGSKICFTLQTKPGDPSSAEIYTAVLPGIFGLTNISDDASKGDINCTWSPDGRLITYSNGVYSQGRLMMEKADDSSEEPILLADDEGSNNFDGNPDWAPDGSPFCPDQTVTTRPGTPITLQLECTDTGPLYERSEPNGYVSEPPARGTLSDESNTTNPSTVVYTPNPGFTGTDKVGYSSFDVYGFGTTFGTVTVEVREPRGEEPPATCGGERVTIAGTPGKDTLRGTNADDVIASGAGADKVRSGAGDDIVCGGAGADKVVAGTGRDRVLGEGGRDRIKGGAGRDACDGGPARDRVDCEKAG